MSKCPGVRFGRCAARVVAGYAWGVKIVVLALGFLAAAAVGEEPEATYRNEPALALCFDAFALTFVPSSATCPSFASPASRHNFKTWTKSRASAGRCSFRKVQIVSWSGFDRPVTAMKSTRSLHAAASFRELCTPRPYPYKSSAVIITGW
jgi:hypothetical protein